MRRCGKLTLSDPRPMRYKACVNHRRSLVGCFALVGAAVAASAMSSVGAHGAATAAHGSCTLPRAMTGDFHTTISDYQAGSYGFSPTVAGRYTLTLRACGFTLGDRVGE